jgi:hypothetical protein
MGPASTHASLRPGVAPVLASLLLVALVVAIPTPATAGPVTAVQVGEINAIGPSVPSAFTDVLGTIFFTA